MHFLPLSGQRSRLGQGARKVEAGQAVPGAGPGGTGLRGALWLCSPLWEPAGTCWGNGSLSQSVPFPPSELGILLLQLCQVVSVSLRLRERTWPWKQKLVGTGGFRMLHIHTHTHTREGHSLCLLSHTDKDGLLIMWVRRPAAHTLAVSPAH